MVVGLLLLPLRLVLVALVALVVLVVLVVLVALVVLVVVVVLVVLAVLVVLVLLRALPLGLVALWRAFGALRLVQQQVPQRLAPLGVPQPAACGTLWRLQLLSWALESSTALAVVAWLGPFPESLGSCC